ncbi:methyl-accepting chemotaxis protein [Motiliproteus sp. MSK22-1]|uniref:methyl-accepting chemotaxis protein n=1 Tax=Motiliproteus sp. MSK22-1 TaxID=1897630 RepID=UPI000977CDCA|nr:methyl-accepting chemotaxis protein [Motiliproteus sp. MSK22-1]OMH25721.1 hypothetical protein BGP75_24610 [Motiliproteus sp. MSK22-1]
MLNIVLAPAIGLMNKLTYSRKFTLISLIYIIPLAGLAYLQLDAVLTDKQLTEQELKGLKQLRVSFEISKLATEYRDLKIIAGSQLPANSPLVNRLTDVRQQLNALLSVLERQNVSAQVKDRLDRIHQEMSKQIVGSVTDLDAKFQINHKVVQESWNLTRLISDQTNLSRDRDSHNFMLMQVILGEFETLLEHQGQLRSFGSMAFRQGVVSGMLESTLNRLTDALEKDQNRLELALMPFDSFNNTDFIAVVEATNNQMKQSILLLDEELMMADELSKPWETFYSQASTTEHTVYRFIDSSLDLIKQQLLKRSELQQRQFSWLLAGALIVFLVSSYLMMGFVMSVRQSIQAILNSAHSLSQGDLTTQVYLENTDELGQLASAFNQMSARIHDLIGEVSATTASVSNQADGVGLIAQQSSNVVESQRRDTEQVATAITEMVASVENVARNTQDASEQSGRVDEEVVRGQQLVNNTLNDIQCLSQDIDHSMEVINRLAKDSDSISQVLNVIKSVAEQTNLLALNAAIEAARAGEQGRGFAVVADEVRTLAQRTQESTAEIESMITSLQTGVKDAVNAMRVSHENVGRTVTQSAQVGESLGQVTEAIASIVEINTRIASAAEQQAVVANEIDRKIVAINSVGDRTAADARSTVDACQSMSAQTERLKGVMSTFRV